MSFGSNFGGFGANSSNNSNNSTQQQTGFAGFGSSNNNTNNATGGFGASTNNTSGFGAANNNSGGSLFGGGNTTGSGFSGFGATNTNNQQSPAFSQPRPFGSSTTTGTSGLFGGNTGAPGTSGFGNFGNTANNNSGTTTSGFGSGSGGTLFGNATQATANTGFGGGGGLFGSQQQNQSTGFGSTNTQTGSGFGQAAAPGFGSGNQAQNNGSGGTPFTPFAERDPNNSTQTQQYQSISAQPQYKDFQFEELRVVDYNQGRKYGNQSGQAGAFGANTGFGGFGTNNNTSTTNTGFGTAPTTSLFGQNQNQTPQPFGAGSTGTGFGGTAGGGLFAKPATTGSGLFGAASSTAGQQTGMFGTAGGTGFGTNNNTSGFGSSGATGGGLFGQLNNQPKPGGLFGSQNTTNNAFGTANNTSAFGSTTTGGGLFGNQNTQQNSTGAFGTQQTTQSSGLFGQNQTQNQTSQQGGGLFGSSTFGNQNQQKPNPFGAPASTGQSLFAQTNNQQQQTQQPQQGTGLFAGMNNQNNQTGGLFGQQQQAKPSLFTNTQAASNTGGLFGSQSTQVQPAQGSSLFSGLGQSQNQNQEKPGGLFGSINNNTNTGGGGMFAGLGQNTNNQQSTGSSLFATNNQNQQAQSGLSFFGNTQLNQQQQQQQPQQPQHLTTSIMSNNPYGNEHLFVSLGTPTQSIGPLMTPLSSSQKARKPAPLPTYRLNPAASSRLLTPQKRSGYGFDYSVYGTPGSAYSHATPPMYGRGLLASGSFGRSLGKSLSASNLRSAYNREESILSPGAFSVGSMGSGSGQMKKLKINRGLRTDLFGSDAPTDQSRASPLKKTVSFEPSTLDKTSQANGHSTNGQSSTALVRVEDTDGPTPTAQEQGYLRSSRQSHSPSTPINGNANQPEVPQARENTAQPEMEQVRGNELAVVPEDSTASPEASVARPAITAEDAARLSQKDMEPGAYYMIPTKAEIEKLPRKDRAKISPFIVGRENTGKIEFDQVDLNNINLDKILGGIVSIVQRSATVYPNQSDKPPEGKGLNVPARITLENSWPRSKGGKVPVFERKGPRFEKHIERLKRVPDTQFEDYIIEKGQWIFRVSHFSTYALDYSDEDENMMSLAPVNEPSAFTSHLSAHSRLSESERSSSNSSRRDSNVDDTFEFRTSRSLPGAFDQSFMTEQEADMTQEYNEEPVRNGSSIFETSQVSNVGSHNLQPNSHSFEADVPMLGPFDGILDNDSPQKHSHTLISPIKPDSLVQGSLRQIPGPGTPSKPFPGPVGDWTSQLQRTLSPKKQNRQTLRASQGIFMKEQRQHIEKQKAALDREKNPFATSIDVMNSLFGQGKNLGGERRTGEGKGFQWPYTKRSKLDPNKDMTESDREFHKSFKPSWAFDGTFIYSAAGPTQGRDNPKTRISFEGNDNEFSCYAAIKPAEASNSLREQQSLSSVALEDGCPRARMSANFHFASLADVAGTQEPSARHETLMWQLASVLFDDIPRQGNPELERKKRLSEFWTEVVKPATNEHSTRASDAGSEHSELAIIQLSGHNIPNATAALIEGKSFRLATMIAQIGGNKTMRDGFGAQLEEWRRTNALSEISPSIRSLYELLAGNTCTATGKSGVAVEDKAETFNISSRFGLDWRRSFGLKLWYGEFEEATIVDVIKAYIRDLAAFKEQIKPLPWFLEQDVNTGWDDPHKDERQDILLGLMKVYAVRRELDHNVDDGFLSGRTKFADTISPQNVSGNPTDASLSFQLYHALSTKNIMDFPEQERDHKADLLATDYAFQLSGAAENLFDAIFVILHLSEASARESAVKALLNRHAGVIENDDSGELFSKLVKDLKIRQSWIWAAKALYAKAVATDLRMECYCLLKAGDEYLEKAHDTLRSLLAPKCIIEDDMTMLREVLEWYVHVRAERLRGWASGGGLYVDYIRLLELAKHGERPELMDLAKKLEDVLAMSADGPLSLEERVAVTEMTNGIRKAVNEVGRRTGSIEAMMDRPGLLPKISTVASDATLKQALKLSDSYYSSVLVAGQ